MRNSAIKLCWSAILVCGFAVEARAQDTRKCLQYPLYEELSLGITLYAADDYADCPMDPQAEYYWGTTGAPTPQANCADCLEPPYPAPTSKEQKQASKEQKRGSKEQKQAIKAGAVQALVKAGDHPVVSGEMDFTGTPKLRRGQDFKVKMPRWQKHGAGDDDKWSPKTGAKLSLSKLVLVKTADGNSIPVRVFAVEFDYRRATDLPADKWDGLPPVRTISIGYETETDSTVLISGDPLTPDPVEGAGSYMGAVKVDDSYYLLMTETPLFD